MNFSVELEEDGQRIISSHYLSKDVIVQLLVGYCSPTDLRSLWLTCKSVRWAFWRMMCYWAEDIALSGRYGELLLPNGGKHGTFRFENEHKRMHLEYKFGRVFSGGMHCKSDDSLWIVAATPVTKCGWQWVSDPSALEDECDSW